MSGNIAVQTRGFGASRKPAKQGPQADRFCLSPQLAPPALSPAAKTMFAQSENYHDTKAARRK